MSSLLEQTLNPRPLPVDRAKVSGFVRVLSSKFPPQRANDIFWEAFAEVRKVVPTETPMEDVMRYLESRYGELTAQEVLSGRSVAAQLGFRRARFLKHFEEVRRKK